MGIKVYPYLSPRLIIVEDPDIEITLQNLVNEIMDWEDDPWNMSYPKVIKPSGKQDLGGSVFVGITGELQNAKVAFEARVTSVSEGNCTTEDTTGTKLIDSAANFTSDGIKPGASIINFTDKSVTTVISVDSDKQITHEILKDGTLNNWQVGDEYKIWNVVQCNISGGNLTAKDDVGNPLDPVSPTAFTQIVRTSSASATLQELDAIQYSSYQNRVWIDVTSSNSGTDYPNGNRENPVNNVQDAVTIASQKGFDTLGIIGDLTLSTGDNVENFRIVGQSSVLTTLTIETAAQTLNCEIEHCHVDGVLDGNTIITLCEIDIINYISGTIRESSLVGTITLGGGSDAHILDCHSGIAGQGTPEINCGGSGQSLGLRNYNGGIKITNKTGINDKVSLDINSGQIILDTTVTAGDIVCRGIAKLTDNSNGATVYNELVNLDNISDTIWDELLSEHVLTGSTGKILNDIFNNSEDADTMLQAIEKLTGHQITRSGDIITIFEADGNTVWRRYDLANGGRRLL